MKAPGKHRWFAVLVGLATLAASASARAEDVVAPSFKTSKNKETKDFVRKVGTVIVKAARAKPEEVELEKYEYDMPRAGRHELIIKMSYTGKFSKLLKKKRYTATIKVKIDSSAKDEWEVLTIDYKDDNSISLLSPSEKKIRKLIPQFNR